MAKDKPHIDEGKIIEPDEVVVPPLPARRPGRPYALQNDERTLAQILALGEMQCTIEEAAGALGVAHTTLLDFFTRHPNARQVFQDGRQYGRASVKRSQYLMAHKVPQMAIWFGKQHLNQSDKQETTTTVVSRDPEEIVKRVNELQKRLTERKPAAPAIPQIGKAGKGGDQP